MMIRCRLYILLILVSLLLPQSAGAAVSYTYDLNGNRLTMTDPTGITYYEYDALNRVTKITNPNGEITSYTYDKIGQRTSVTLPNGVVTTYAYDAAGRLLDLVHQLNATNVGAFSYTYDKVGNRTSMTDEYGSHSYVYDQLSRLIQATHPQPANPMEQFAYDPVGNRLGGTYDAGNRLLEDADYYYDYDKNGNTTQKLSKTTGELSKLYYDAENQLTKIEKYHAMSDTVPYSSVSYIYDGLGRRVAKNIDSAITKYVYDQEDILLETDVNDAIQARYTHGPGIDEPISMDRGGSSYYYIADGLGSIVKLVDAAGTTVVNNYVYDSFGNIVEKTEGVTNFYTYTAREYDAESGLYYYRARYYDAAIGRFVSEDPIELAGGVNFYLYAFNNSIKYVDPLGLKLWYADKASETAMKPYILKIMKTPKGRQLLKQLHDAPETYYIHANYGPYGPAYQLGSDVYVDPSFHPDIVTNCGTKPASTTRILAHELGHLTGTKDDGPWQMNNINTWENPIMYPIEGYNRIRY